MDLALPVLEGDSVKAFLRTADIHTDDDGPRFAVIHTDSRARTDARDIFFFAMADGLVE